MDPFWRSIRTDRSRESRARVVVVLALFVLAACQTNDTASVATEASATTRATTIATTSTTQAIQSTTTTTTAAATTSTTTAETTATIPTTTPPSSTTFPSGDVRYEAPFDVAPTPGALSDRIVEAEETLRSDAPRKRRVAAGKRVQTAYRQLATTPEWDQEVLDVLPDDIEDVARRNVVAARALLELISLELPDSLPAWRVVEPRPPGELIGFYREAATAVEIDWELLAAINLVETRMGRIRGTSTAGAQGPMQFIPTSWEIYGEGGDINDDRDAIFAAARHLVDRAGDPFDVDRALRGYNNHPAYVEAVKAYAANISDHPGAYLGYHAWEVYFTTTNGVFWLPVGYHETESVPVDEYLQRPIVELR